MTINTIMSFNAENIVKWNVNYLKGYTSEKCDMNIELLKIETRPKILK